MSQHPEIKAVDVKKADKNMGRLVHVASYIPLSPPPTTPIINKGEMMALLFARDLKYIFFCTLSDSRDIEEVSAAVGKTLNSFISEFKPPDKNAKTTLVRTESPVAHLVYRFIGLSKFGTAAIKVPEDAAWLFLYLHQLMYEKTAIAYPTESGMHNKTKQQIQTAVNRDIKALSNAKFGPGSLSKNDEVNNKVLPPSFAADFARNRCYSFSSCAGMWRESSVMAMREMSKTDFASVLCLHLRSLLRSPLVIRVSANSVRLGVFTLRCKITSSLFSGTLSRIICQTSLLLSQHIILESPPTQFAPT